MSSAVKAQLMKLNNAIYEKEYLYLHLVLQCVESLVIRPQQLDSSKQKNGQTWMN